MVLHFNEYVSYELIMNTFMNLKKTKQLSVGHKEYG